MPQKTRNLLCKFGLLMVTIAWLLVPVAMAQTGSTTARVNITITDESGGAISGASVIARNINTNLTREAVSDTDGGCLITELPPGIYEVKLSAEGFKAQTLRFEVQLGVAIQLKTSLKVGAVSDIVEVVADAEVQGTTESSTNQSSERIANLPINQRDFLDFALTSPRVAPDRVPQQQSFPASGLSVNGQSSRFNNITIDGLDNNENAAGGVRSTFSQEAVQEFQVVSDNYSAEFGRATSAVINIVTKSGTNEFHGSLFNFLRNDSTSARDVFSSIKPEFKQYQFGGTISGPIQKDRKYFFASFERLSVKQNSIITISDTVVNAGRRQGLDISNGPLPFSVGLTSILARADLQLKPNDLLYIRYNGGFRYDGSAEPFGGLVAQTNGGVLRLNDNSVAFNNTYTNGPLALVNETRFLYSHRDNRIVTSDPANGPLINLIAPEGSITIGRSLVLPIRLLESTYQIVDNVSLSRGRNQIKFGIDFLYVKFPEDTETAFEGGLALFAPIQFPIPGTPPLSGLDAFDPASRTPAQRAVLIFLSNFLKLPGLADEPIPTIYFQGFGNAKVATNLKSFSAFVQDEFKLRPNLLIKAGIRYDISRANFIPSENGNFSPRLAISYSPKRFPKMQLHASGGLFFGQLITGAGSVAHAIGVNPSDQFRVIGLPFPFSLAAYNQPQHHYPISPTIPAGLPLIPQLSADAIYDPHAKTSYSAQISAGINYALDKNTLIFISYDYVRGIRQFGMRYINSVVHPVPGDPIASLETGRINPDAGYQFQFETAYDSYYHALTLAYNRRLSHNIGLLASYTFSKSIDDNIDIRVNTQEIADPQRIDLEKSLSVQDVRSRFLASGTWDLNYTKNPFLRGFQISSIVELSSGRPYNLLAGVDLNQSFDFPTPTDRPIVGGIQIGRNLGITPGFANVNMRITRVIDFKERYHMQLFFEVFNLFNRVNISDVARIFPPDAQGNFQLPRKDGNRFIAEREQFRNAFAPRQCQFGFRFNF